MNDCVTCADLTGTKRYCAPGRCYCGHADCHAIASFVALSDIPQPTTVAAPRSRAWIEREDPTWIDKL